ncbi:MAG: P-loop NTPase [Bacteroidetes bacterium]|jgi:MinD superfamily P-loop ATPase|nr:P-loop NTPase [Bacteroidota bacterium]
MKEITILSGKGGTGKTSITAALASIANNEVYCDNDVDASDLHLIFHPDIQETHTFTSGWKMTIEPEKCTECNICIDYCRFDAIHKNATENLEINHFQCEGCRLCERICPVQAIYSFENSNHCWYVSASRFGNLVHACMEPGEENSGKLVTQLRKRGRELAMEKQARVIINDGPPGIGCASISSLAGTDCVLIVTESSISGLHDVQRLIELVQSFHIEMYVIINKYDLNNEMALAIEKYLESINIPVIARLPFMKDMVAAINEGKSIIEYKPESSITKTMQDIWEVIRS